MTAMRRLCDTANPTGDGTGLGFSIGNDSINQLHSGTIAVDRRPGDFTEFSLGLPRSAAPLPAA